MRGLRFIAAAAFAAIAAGCQGDTDQVEPRPATESTPEVTGRIVEVRERWVSEADTAWNLDTPALLGSGDSAVVLVTAKGTHDLKVFDAATGATLPAIGTPGAGAGQFMRPNAVYTVGDLSLVVERDNHRIQVLKGASTTPAGSFGEAELALPYGIAVAGALPDLTLWVTDDFEATAERDLSHRVHRFDVRFAEDGTPTVLGNRVIGTAEGEGALAVVETIGVDPQRNRLLIADEVQKAYLVFDTAGIYQGERMGDGFISGDPEGMALVGCPDGSGYWIATDQQDGASFFRVFRRDDLHYIGTFHGPRTNNTDGVSFAPGSVAGFDGPAFFAVDDDQALSAFAWTDIVDALGLQTGCGVAPVVAER